MFESKTLPDVRLGGATSINMGVIPSSRTSFAVNPTNNDTIGIGSTTFRFVTTLAAATTVVQVKIGASAAATLANLIDAVNGKQSTAGTAWVEATTAFSLPLFADNPTATSFRIRMALQRGSATLVAGTIASTALTKSITGDATIWQMANLNESGKLISDVQFSQFKKTVTAANITAGGVFIELPFTPTIIDVYVADATGLLRSITDLVTVSGNAVNIQMAGGVAPKIQSGDIVSVYAQV